MTEDGERTVERQSADSDSATAESATDASEAAAADRPADEARTVDDAAESFLDVESRLKGSGEATLWGRAVNVERVPADAVPEDYPVEIATAEALALTLAVDTATDTEREAVVYFEWSEGDADDRLGRLLALQDIPQQRFADLHGESILLTYEDGHYLPYVPPEGVRGSAAGVYGVGAGLAVNLLAALLVGVGLGSVLSSVGALVVLLGVNFLLLPLATYADGWYLRTQTDWGQGPAFWALLAAIPGVNVLSSLLYLDSRRRATPLVE